MTAICWVTLVVLAHAFLVIATAVQGHTEQSGSNTADALITLTVNGFRRLFIALLLGPASARLFTRRPGPSAHQRCGSRKAIHVVRLGELLARPTGVGLGEVGLTSCR